MATPRAPGLARKDGTKPGYIVGGTVVMVAVATFLIYAVSGYSADQDALTGGQVGRLAGPASAGACGSQATPADSSYSVEYATAPDPPRPEGTTVTLTVRHDGKAVSGARVCLTADMPEMQHPGVNKASDEVSGGRYEARLQFGMGGSWRMSVTVAEPNKPVVSLPLVIQVAEIDS